MLQQPLSYLDFLPGSLQLKDKTVSGKKVMQGTIAYGTPPGVGNGQPGYTVGPLQKNWTMGNTPLVLAAGGAVIGLIALSFYIAWKVGQAFAPTSKDEKKYGWIGIGVATIGIPAALKLVQILRG